MGRTQNLFRQLDTLEEQFQRRLIRELRLAADGKNDLLFLKSEATRRFGLHRSFGAKADELASAASRIFSLRAKLGQPVDLCLAARFVVSCDNWSNVSDEHRGSAKTIAHRLLKEIVT